MFAMPSSSGGIRQPRVPQSEHSRRPAAIPPGEAQLATSRVVLALALAVRLAPYDRARWCARMTDSSKRRHGNRYTGATPPTEAEVAAAAAAALRQAEAEGTELLLAPGTASGYAGVVVQPRAVAFPYRAQIRKDGTTVGLGSFICKEEASLCYSRALGAEGLARRKAEMSKRAAAVPTDEEIFAQAASEGLELIPAANTTGYKGVAKYARNKTKPFEASVFMNGTRKALGTYPSAAAAALACARERHRADGDADADASSSNAASAAAADAREMVELLKLSTPAAVAARAAVEGLELMPTERSESGYRGVYAQRSRVGGGRIRSYIVKTYTNGVAKQRGRPFVLAEQAALYYARCVKRDAEGQAAAVEAAGQQSMAGLLAASLVS